MGPPIAYLRIGGPTGSMHRCKSVSMIIDPSVLHPIKFCRLRSQCSTKCNALKQLGRIAGNGKQPEIDSNNLPPIILGGFSSLTQTPQALNRDVPMTRSDCCFCWIVFFFCTNYCWCGCIAPIASCWSDITGFVEKSHLGSVNRWGCKARLLLSCCVTSTWRQPKTHAHF